MRGEMTIQTISKQHTGGVTKKKDQPEWMANGRSSMPPGPTRASLRIQARDKLMYKSKLMRGWPDRIRLVAAEQQSLIEVAKSTDFGATSTKPPVIANTTNAGTDKDIVVVNGRDVYVGYNHAQTVRVSSSHDGGHTFTSANVNHNAQFGWLSDQQSSNRQCWQRLLLVGGLYQNGGAKGPVNIYVSKSSDGGNTWTETLVVSIPPRRMASIGHPNLMPPWRRLVWTTGFPQSPRETQATCESPGWTKLTSRIGTSTIEVPRMEVKAGRGRPGSPPS